ncbi:MAG: hypothetical protein ACOCXG_00075 [Nanoarchaeota archaeon]
MEYKEVKEKLLADRDFIYKLSRELNLDDLEFQIDLLKENTGI